MNDQTKRKSNAHLIEACSLSFSYNHHNNNIAGRALKDVSFFVDEGERIAILGHNGSGKSTLVKILGGLQEASEGQCLINGVNISEINFRDLRTTIGIVFQDPENQIVAAMVEDDAAFAPENQGLPSGEIQARVDDALQRVNLMHKQGSSVSALSGGEKQRLALAGVLTAHVKCLILDEATAMLDPVGRLNIERVLKELHKSGMTIIQVTHQLEPENFDDIQRVIVLSHGEIIWQGATQDFWADSEALGFDLPDEFRIKKYFDSHNINFPDYFASLNINSSHYASREDSINTPVKFVINNLSFKYDDEKLQTIKNLSASIYSGQWLSIVGRTGSGKSTLVQHLNALYKIQSGEILFDSKPLAQKGKEVYELRQKVGLVFQHPEDQLFSLTVRDELAFAPKNAGFNKHELDEAILYALECVGLEKSFLDRNPLALSGGERRLAAIASVLSAKPECIALDEPLAGLDAHYQHQILNMLTKFKNDGKTVITITHDLNAALNYSDRILILRDGSTIQEGSPDEVIKSVMQNLESGAWPDVLRISAKIHEINKNFPLLYNYEDFISCISQV
ncbi:MAG: ATP-binding cassette domain-containing protein [Synergistaceae bacterium]|nr:ATP-binding cassette domain-containing protein [Synergistaceae bacterium]